MKIIKLNKEYSLDLGSLAPVKVKPLIFKENTVLCEYLNSYSDRVEELTYNLFEMNGYYKPKNIKETTLHNLPESSTPNFLLYGEEDTNSIVIRIKDIEYIRVNEEGFFWKGILVEDDKEIYEKFNRFLGIANE